MKASVSIPPYLLVFGALFLIVGGIGGALWWWAASELDSARAARDQVVTKLTATDRRAILPTPENLEAITAKNAEFTALLEASLPKLQAASRDFAAVILAWRDGRPAEGLSPDAWKRLMNEKRLELDRKAEANRVKLPENFYYGFSRYRLPNPEAQFTAELGVQLIALNRLASILIDSRVEAIQSMRRVQFEDGPRAGGPIAGEEGLAASILQDPLKLYWLYPFEVTFRCATVQLARVVQGIAEAPELFLIRFIQIENEVSEIKRRSAIQPQTGNQLGQTDRLFVTVVGDELLNIRLRVDLLLWAEGSSAGGTASPGGNQGREASP